MTQDDRPWWEVGTDLIYDWDGDAGGGSGALDWLFGGDGDDSGALGSAWDWLVGGEGSDGPGSGVPLDALLMLLGGYGGYKGWGDADIDKVGYQGEIPDYAAVRQQVPIDDTNRRPGESGRRYFTDTIYAKPPEEFGDETWSYDKANYFLTGQNNQLQQQNADKVNPPSQYADLHPLKQLKMLPQDEQDFWKKFHQAGLTAGTDKPQYAQGGIVDALSNLRNPAYKRGPQDGMADTEPAMIDGKQPAEFSHGEFMVPADVVSHLGNGNSDAGAEQLYSMMKRIRKARTGKPSQGREINPQQFLPR